MPDGMLLIMECAQALRGSIQPRQLRVYGDAVQCQSYNSQITSLAIKATLNWMYEAGIKGVLPACQLMMFNIQYSPYRVAPLLALD